jgi:hypothetical protein
VASLATHVAVSPTYVTTTSAAAGPSFASGSHSLAANFPNSQSNDAFGRPDGHNNFHKLSGSQSAVSTALLDKNNSPVTSQPPVTSANLLPEAYGTVPVALRPGQQQQLLQHTNAQPVVVTTSTVPTTVVQASILNSSAGPKLGTYHNRNFVQAEAGVQSSVFLVPTVQSDGSVAYALHHSPQVKIVSPLKAGPSIIPLVQLPASGGGAAMEGIRPARAAAVVRPANKTRQPPKILPKGAAPPQSTARFISGGKVIRLAAGQRQEESGSGAPVIAANTTRPNGLTSENNGFSVVGLCATSGTGVAPCTGIDSNLNTGTGNSYRYLVRVILLT